MDKTYLELFQYYLNWSQELVHVENPLTTTDFIFRINPRMTRLRIHFIERKTKLTDSFSISQVGGINITCWLWPILWNCYFKILIKVQQRLVNVVTHIIGILLWWLQFNHQKGFKHIKKVLSKVVMTKKGIFPLFSKRTFI